MKPRKRTNAKPRVAKPQAKKDNKAKTSIAKPKLFVWIQIRYKSPETAPRFYFKTTIIDTKKVWIWCLTPFGGIPYFHIFLLKSSLNIGYGTNYQRHCERISCYQDGITRFSVVAPLQGTEC